jgi:hypothetical protein
MFEEEEGLLPKNVFMINELIKLFLLMNPFRLSNRRSAFIR